MASISGLKRQCLSTRARVVLTPQRCRLMGHGYWHSSSVTHCIGTISGRRTSDLRGVRGLHRSGRCQWRFRRNERRVRGAGQEQQSAHERQREPDAECHPVQSRPGRQSRADSNGERSARNSRTVAHGSARAGRRELNSSARAVSTAHDSTDSADSTAKSAQTGLRTTKTALLQRT